MELPHRPTRWIGLHEVYYSDNGAPSLYTAKPVGFVAGE